MLSNLIGIIGVGIFCTSLSLCRIYIIRSIDKFFKLRTSKPAGIPRGISLSEKISQEEKTYI